MLVPLTKNCTLAMVPSESAASPVRMSFEPMLTSTGMKGSTADAPDAGVSAAGLLKKSDATGSTPACATTVSVAPAVVVRLPSLSVTVAVTE